MLKSPRKPNKKAAPVPKLVAVIKNNLTEQEMNASGEHWANHKGPYMTVAETLAYAAARAASRTVIEQIEAPNWIAKKTKLIAARSAHFVLRAREERKPRIGYGRRP